jgi:hypothetical protein
MYQEWLRKGLAKKGKSHQGLANAIGYERSVVTKMANGQRKIRADELDKIASYIDEPIPHREWGNHSKGPDNDSVAFVEAIAGGGIWREARALTMYVDMVIPVYSDPRVAGLRQHAVRVEGTDFNKHFHPGDLALFVPFWERRKVPADGDIVEIERKNGNLVETTIRRVRVTPDGYEFWVESDDPKWKDEPPILVKDIHKISGGMQIKGLYVALYRPNPNL